MKKVKTYYKNDLKHAYLILEGEEEQKDDYQMLMLRENEIPGILKTEVRFVDGRNQYYYDISGKTSFKTVYDKVKLSYGDMKKLVSDLLAAIQNLQRYMLDGNCLLLEPEYIFREKGEYYFCYYFSENGNPQEAFHQLTEFFVREVDYKDEEGVHFAYTLHKATMEENYSIEQIMQELLPEQGEACEEMAENPLPDYTRRMENPIIEDKLMEERNNIWQPMRKILGRAKRRQLGYEEEDL